MRYAVSAHLVALALAAGSLAVAPAVIDARQAPAGSMALGNVTIGKNVMADGKPLRAGTYSLRLTADNATPVPAGQTADYERWVEFLRGGKVVGREVVSIVPQSEIQIVAQDTPPRPGGTKVQLLKGNDYLRIWVHRGGNHYLIHLPTGASVS